MNNNNKDKNEYWDKYTRSQQNEISRSKRDEDLIIEENTIYEIDRDCVERLKRNRKRLN